MPSSVPLARLTFLIAILTAVGQMTQTMYVPSIGHMASEFIVDPAVLQAVMACYLIPYGLSQFIYGPLSDRLGRKPIIVVGLIIYLLGTLVALFAHNYDVFLLGSFIQGAGIGCGGAMARTLTRDCFEGSRLHRANSLISMCVIFSPLVAPLLGGYLTETFGWRSSYLFLALFAAAVVLTMITSFKETLPKSRRNAAPVWQNYRYVLSNRRFQGYLGCLIATFSGVAVFEAAAGVLLGGTLNLPATVVSLLFIAPIPGYLAGAGLSSVIAEKFSEKYAMNFGLIAAILGSGIVLLPGLNDQTTAVTLVGGATVYFLGAGVLFPAATTGAIAPFPAHAGTAGAVLGGMQNFGAGVATLAASALPASNQLPLGIIMLVCAIAAFVSLIWVDKHPDSQQNPEISAI
ncbi:multidrug efflux MFS transporter EmrD [Vibrio nigripulchritudo]|uniref:multidrug efflux MFS transporter EmrD n=1 Tax=Vibrio nigripulchritudo TaxID=28173 RepID=UPI0003B1967E|nr:multidrug efflux MFS transporter EmrD [Vibrio nigripulchritudo]CCN68657.1 putative Multidrug resistance protein D [Vibrio nigripulchritudo SFn118]